MRLVPNYTIRKVSDLIAYKQNPRRNDPGVDALAAHIKRVGFLNPILIDKDNVIVAGHTRLKAAKKLGLEEVPCILADHLTPEEIEEHRVLDNRIGEKSDWDFPLLQQVVGCLDLTSEAMQLAWTEDERARILNNDWGDMGEAERKDLLAEASLSDEYQDKPRPIYLTQDQRTKFEEACRKMRRDCDFPDMEEGKIVEYLSAEYLS